MKLWSYEVKELWGYGVKGNSEPGAADGGR